MRRPWSAAPVRLLATAGMATLAAVAAGCSGSAASSGAAPRSSAPRGTPATSVAVSASPSPSRTAASPWPLVLAVPAVKAGERQTQVQPHVHSAVFQAEMTDLWAGVVSGRPELAMPAFFPVVAYEQVKAIGDPAADWRYRLVVEFRADVIAAHDLIGTPARNATLVRVVVPEQQADWIGPGVCYNSVGYWHVAGARVVYRAGGQEKSFGIASLISWRGRWYVVHLGGVLRAGTGGMVDEPAAGPGVPGPPGGC